MAVFEGEMLRRARQERGLSQRQLAAKVGCSQAAISQIEGGHPTIATLERIAHVLGFQVIIQLVDRDEEWGETAGHEAGQPGKSVGE